MGESAGKVLLYGAFAGALGVIVVLLLIRIEARGYEKGYEAAQKDNVVNTFRHIANGMTTKPEVSLRLSPTPPPAAEPPPRPSRTIPVLATLVFNVCNTDGRCRELTVATGHAVPRLDPGEEIRSYEVVCEAQNPEDMAR